MMQKERSKLWVHPYRFPLLPCRQLSGMQYVRILSTAHHGPI
uniref:Uncharacterized protein n=1 Tax=Siphoviridae sp. ctTBd21 TaxID=2825516 RepID=A0A8S5Q659_9CAUD|nr:MAG TPA: hypothetical protein [Siphoviridae sp. ctTBd21]